MGVTSSATECERCGGSDKAAKERTNAANLHASAGKSAEGRLGARARGLGASATGGTELDVEGSNANLLAASSDILRGKHSSVRRRLITIGLDLHAACTFRARLAQNCIESVRW